MRKPQNYVNNADFYQALKDYQAKVKAYKAGELKKEPVMSDYIGACFMEIARGLARRGNFSGYSYIDEMVDDGIENAVMAIHSFDAENYDKPFAYFTKIIWWAFLRRIDKEKKQSYIKHMSLVNASMNDLVNGGMDNILIDDQKASSYMEKFEKKKKIKKAVEIAVIKENMDD